MKQCNNCLTVKDYSEFYRGKCYKDGYRACCKNCLKGYQVDYRKNNPETLEYSKKYNSLNKRKINNRSIQRRKNSSVERVKNNLRSRLAHSLNSKSWHKTSKFNDYIGCTKEQLIHHIESQFVKGMSWSNYGHKTWHIDHIIPLSSANTEEEVIKLCHYSNLQPLWAIDNIKKGNKIK